MTGDDAEREQELVAAWRAGDIAAFEKIVGAYRRKLFAIALRNTGSVAAAEDSVQVALHNAFRGIGRLDGKIELGPWLTAIVKNAAVNESRNEARQVKIARGLSEEAERAKEQSESEGPSRDSLDRIERLELGQILYQGIAELPAPYREALELFHVQGLSVAQISRVLDVHPGTVKTHLARGRTLLHRRIERRLREGGYL